jgi:hypothetical protein
MTRSVLASLAVNLLVLTATSSEVRRREMLKRLEGESGGTTAFLFKTARVSSLTTPAMGLLFEPWERAGSPPLRIDE